MSGWVKQEWRIRCDPNLEVEISIWKTQQIRVKSLLNAFRQFGTAGTRSANSMIDSPSLFQLLHPDTDIFGQK